MAKLYITEYQYSAMAAGGGGAANRMPAGQEPAIVVQVLAIGALSVQSAPFSARTNFVRLHCDEVCSVEFGTNPTATANSSRLAANQTEFFGVHPGNLIAVIINT